MWQECEYVTWLLMDFTLLYTCHLSVAHGKSCFWGTLALCIELFTVDNSVNIFTTSFTNFIPLWQPWFAFYSAVYFSNMMSRQSFSLWASLGNSGIKRSYLSLDLSKITECWWSYVLKHAETWQKVGWSYRLLWFQHLMMHKFWHSAN